MLKKFQIYFLIALCLISLSSAFNLKKSQKKLSVKITSCPLYSTGTYSSVIGCIKQSVPQATVIQSSDASYSTFNYQWNLFKPKSPKAYIYVKYSFEVKQTILCTTKYNYPLAVRGGGHSYEKYSYGPTSSIVLDIGGINDVLVDKVKKIADIGAGALLGHVYYKLWLEGKFGIPAGSCPLVGISGHILGGGYGVSSRKYGLMIDNVLEMEMVDVLGNIRIVNANTNADLFWALRGGGQGSFGIVTKFKIKLFDASKTVYIIEKTYPDTPAGFNLAINAFQNYLISNPPNSVTPLFNSASMTISYVIQPESISEYNSLKIDINSYATGNPKTKESQMSFIKMIFYYGIYGSLANYVKFESDLLKVKATMITPFYFHAKAHFVSKKLTTAEITSIYYSRNSLKTAYGLWGGYFLLDSYGGKISEVSNTATSFRHRTGIYYGIQTIMESPNNWNKTPLNKFDFDTAFWYNAFSFQNYVDEDMTNALDKYYGTNLVKLKEYKRKYDPNNYFCFPMSIPLN